MSVGIQVQTNVISTVINLVESHVFTRICDEIKRVEASMPHATGADKRAKFLAECKIIFDDLVEPIGENVLRLLLEIGLIALKSAVVAAIA
jgi:hypothetical protein